MSVIDDDIKKGQLKSVYLLFGTETFMVRSYRDRLITAALGKKIPELDGDMNFTRYTGTNVSPKEVSENAQTLPFFAEKRVILIDGSDWFKKSSEDVVKCISSIPESCLLIFTEKNVDKRLSEYKTVTKCGLAAEFGEQDIEELRKWIVIHVDKNHKKITRGAVERLLQSTGSDMSSILIELEKLYSYCLYKEAIETQDVEELCHVKVQDRGFEMIDLMARKRRNEALRLYYDLLELKEPPQKILALMERHFRILIAVKDLKSKGMRKTEISEKLGIKPFEVEKCMVQSGHFSMDNLQNALKDAATYDFDVKRGRLPEKMAVEFILLKYSEEEDE